MYKRQSKNCSVAISDGEKLLCLCEEVADNYKQSESLHTFVEWALEGAEISLKDLDAVSLGKGPGSYTGLRIGAASAKGFCYGLKIPLIAVNSLETVSYTHLDVYKRQEPVGVYFKISKDSNHLIEEFMLLANRTV